VLPGTALATTTPKYSRGNRQAKPNMQRSLDEWITEAPRLECDWEPLKATYRRSLVDLAALRFSPRIAGGKSLPAAGLPWFMTMFGRDSIFTSLQALPFQSELAATTLRVLGDWQGTRLDDFRDEDPGRILHEMRYGEMAAFEERPHTPYYGSVDADAALRDPARRVRALDRRPALVRDLEREARAAINWIDEYADLMGNGYISYKRRNEKTGPREPELEGLLELDLVRRRPPAGLPAGDLRAPGLRLRREGPRGPAWPGSVWKDEAYADKLEAEAADLKRRFNRDFWLADRGYYALALDADGSQVDSLASNNGLLLWSGIVDANKAKQVVAHLMGPRLWSGWGVRTLAEGEGRYNPVGYHLGTVWPFDNSFIAWGLRRYGFKEEAAKIASGILDAAVVFEGRLPEAFGGYDRDLTKYPGQVPDGLQPAGLVDRGAAAAAADDARARADGRTT
jgi:glycogen debranching enzyme